MDIDRIKKCLEEDVRCIKGIGDKTAEIMGRLNIFTVGDLLSHYPTGYEQYLPPVDIAKAPVGEVCAVRCRLSSPFSIKKGRKVSIYTCRVSDGTGQLTLSFFNAPYIRNILRPGTDYCLRGTIDSYHNMEHPAIYPVTEYKELCRGLVAKYGLTKGLTQKGIKKAVAGALELLREAIGERAVFEETAGEGLHNAVAGPSVRTASEGLHNTDSWLPEGIMDRFSLLSHLEALTLVHKPVSQEALEQGRRRLVFEEFFAFVYKLRCEKVLGEAGKDDSLPTNRHKIESGSLAKKLMESLPFDLTGAQRRTFEEIEADLCSGKVMNRLIQGDVGSGKTLIALLSILTCVENGFQAALMAPTEVLAIQHFENISVMAADYGLPLRPVLLTGGMGAKRRRVALADISSGAADLIIGTHALIQEGVKYKDLALVVTDEQHRFGVRQREILAEKGMDTHVLVMSATPIPRTLALILYGDLSISVVDEKPAMRLPIKNVALGPGSRERGWRFIMKELKAGHQAYIICPMIEEGEMEGLQNVTDYTEKVRNFFPPEIRIAKLHGAMRAAEKSKIMEAFAAGKTDILVSTTVIEVGIDVANATVIMIENSERFGLSQLHQLRGRTGRGADQSYCIFMTGDEKAVENERLKVMVHSNDGFHIAEEDLRLRGPGDLMGIRQSGDLGFELADICRDGQVLKEAAAAAEYSIENGLPYKHITETRIVL